MEQILLSDIWETDDSWECFMNTHLHTQRTSCVHTALRLQQHQCFLQCTSAAYPSVQEIPDWIDWHPMFFKSAAVGACSTV